MRELILESKSAKGRLSLGKEATESAANDPWASASQKKKLEDVLAWLLLNSMRSEHLQHMQLCQQCLHNIWRRRAFARLLSSEVSARAYAYGECGHACLRAESREISRPC